jgi:hypothetical protein
MQAAESICLWNYQFKNNHPKETSPATIDSPLTEATSYPICTEHLTCQNEISTNAHVYCIECRSLQCLTCDGERHSTSPQEPHQRLTLEEIVDQWCTLDRRHRAQFYCVTCKQYFCLLCFDYQHPRSAERTHKVEKTRREPSLMHW